MGPNGKLILTESTLALQYSTFSGKNQVGDLKKPEKTLLAAKNYSLKHAFA